MSQSLRQILLASDRKEVVSSVVDLIDLQVKSASGVTGIALKGGYKVFKAMKNGQMVYYAADRLLDAFADALDPLYQEYLGGVAPSFVQFTETRQSDIAQALLLVTDKRLDTHQKSNPIVSKIYRNLRPTALSYVKNATPGLARIIDQFAPKC